MKIWSGKELKYRGFLIKNNKNDGYLEIYDEKNHFIKRVENLENDSITDAKIEIDKILKSK